MAADASFDPRQDFPQTPDSSPADVGSGPDTAAPWTFRQAAAAATDTASLVKGLGWFGVGLGLAEMLAPKAVARATGLQGHETLLRFYGVREFTTGVALLRPGTDKAFWIRARIVGDALDAATLLYAMRPGNPTRGRAIGAFAAVSPVVAADLLCAYQLRNGRKLFG